MLHIEGSLSLALRHLHARIERAQGHHVAQAFEQFAFRERAGPRADRFAVAIEHTDHGEGEVADRLGVHVDFGAIDLACARDADVREIGRASWAHGRLRYMKSERSRVGQGRHLSSTEGSWRRARHRKFASASHLDRADTDHGADAASEPVDRIAVTDVDGSRYQVFVRIRPGADGSEPKARNARLVEQATERGMHIAGVELQKKHRSSLSLLVYLYWRFHGLLFRFSGLSRGIWYKYPGYSSIL
jgi:hypothetical protein